MNRPPAPPHHGRAQPRSVYARALRALGGGTRFLRTIAREMAPLTKLTPLTPTRWRSVSWDRAPRSPVIEGNRSNGRQQMWLQFGLIKSVLASAHAHGRPSNCAVSGTSRPGNHQAAGIKPLDADASRFGSIGNKTICFRPDSEGGRVCAPPPWRARTRHTPGSRPDSLNQTNSSDSSGWRIEILKFSPFLKINWTTFWSGNLEVGQSASPDKSSGSPGPRKQASKELPRRESAI